MLYSLKREAALRLQTCAYLLPSLGGQDKLQQPYMADTELRAEVVTFRCKEAYVYQVPPAGTIGHRAETWNVDKWLQVGPVEKVGQPKLRPRLSFHDCKLQEVTVQVITHQDDCWVRLLDFKTGK